MIDTKQHVNSLVTNVIEDKNGVKVDIYTYCDKSHIVAANEMPKDTPIGGVIQSKSNQLLLNWEDNLYRGVGLIQVLNRWIANPVVNGKYYTRDNDKGVDHQYSIMNYNADFIAVVRRINNVPVACGGVKDDGEVVNFWIDDDFRGSKPMQLHIALAFGYALKYKIIANGIDILYTTTHKDNIASNKYQIKFGYKLVGIVERDGTEYNRYEQSTEDRIAGIKKFAMENGTII